MATKETISASLKAHKAHATRLINKSQNAIDNEVKDLSILQPLVTKLDAKTREIETLQTEYLKVLELDSAKLTSDAMNAIVDDQVDFIENCDILIFKLNKIVKSVSDESSSETSRNNSFGYSQSKRVKLPNIELEKFDGTFSQWTSFWDSFDANINSRKDVSDVDKFAYLKGVLVGNAKERIKNFPVTNENYAKVIEILKSTYACKEKIIWDLIYKLNDVKNPAYKFNELDSFRTTVESCMTNLEVQGLDKTAGSPFIAPVIFRKLPFKVKDMVQLRSNNNYPTLQEILDALEQIISNLSSHTDQPSESSPLSKPHKKFVCNNNKSLVEKKDVSNFNLTVNKNKTQYDDKCIFCSEKHKSRNCSNYRDIESRTSRILELNRCTRCLKKGHVASNCKSILKQCFVCKSNVLHHSFMCVNDSVENVNVTMSTVESSAATNVAIPTAMLCIYTKIGIQNVRCMFDQCSQKSFILADTARKLDLKLVGKINLGISGFLSEKSTETYNVVELSIKTLKGDIKLEVVVADKFPEMVKTKYLAVAINKLKALNVNLADPNINSDCINDIKILIGLDNYFKFFEPDQVVNNVNLIDSTVGKVVVGEIPYDNKVKVCTSTGDLVQVNRLAVNVQNNEIFDPPIHKLWDLDAVGLGYDKTCPDDDLAMCKFLKSITFTNNRYSVNLPWKVSNKELPSNYGLALGRLNSTVRNLQEKDNYLKFYDDIIKSQLKDGFIERVENRPSEHCHYLPHMAVHRDSSTTPIRIVYDCSARMNKKSPSLNDFLLTGPNLNDEMVRILIKFRTETFAYTADISKAFLRVGIEESDRDFLRFLWLKDIYDQSKGLDIFRFRSVLFGSTCGPFLLMACLNFHLDKYNDELSNFTKNNVYIDNLFGYSNDENKLISNYNELNDRLIKGNFKLQEWASNSKKLNDLAKRDDIGLNKDIIKVLGLNWNFHNDKIKLKEVKYENNNENELTKRMLLSEISKVFDPLGFTTPVTVKGKILLQKIWNKKCNWDDIVSHDLVLEWNKLKPNLIKISDIEYPRMIANSEYNYDLHIFCDASSKALGSVAYLLNKNLKCVNLVISKSRIAPMSKRTIPQLELTAVVVGAKLARYVYTTLEHINIVEIFLWTDSEIVLNWVIHNKSKDLFVKNRIKQIHDISEVNKFRFVDSKSNPADLISRGVTASALLKSNEWFNGPSWLIDENLWPELPSKFITECEVNVQSTTVQIIDKINFVRFSKFSKLVNTYIYVFQFIVKLKNKVNFRKDVNQIIDVNTINVNYAMKNLIRIVQSNNFGETVQYCKTSKGKVTELIKTLNVFIDDDILRCKGRISNADLPYNTRYPILLPKSDQFTKLLVMKFHEKVHHGGVQMTINKLREEFWITQARQCVKSVIKNCYICKRLEGTNYKMPVSPDLPVERVDKDLLPFEVVGVDLTGNILILNKDIGDYEKFYVVLFTCTTTRAIHLEVVKDLSTKSFLNAFIRFASRRGTPKLIISDNASNFKESSKILKDLINTNEVQSHLKENFCKWNFIPARSPHFGGFYERLIGVTKSCIKKSIFKRKCNEDEFKTIICEIELTLNNRPLGYIDNDINNLQILTPCHLLFGRKLNSFPIIDYKNYDEVYELDNDKANKYFKRINAILNKFKDNWQKEYLIALREQHNTKKVRGSQIDVNINDVVLISDDNINRINWKLGKVIEILPGKDNKVRVVKLKTSSGETLRSINKCYPLESYVNNLSEKFKPSDSIVNASVDNNSDSNISIDNTINDSASNQSRPKRRAAVKFREQLSTLIKDDRL